MISYASEQDGRVRSIFTCQQPITWLSVAYLVFSFCQYFLDAISSLEVKSFRWCVVHSIWYRVFGVLQSFFGFNMMMNMISWFFILGPGILLAHKNLDACIKSDYSIADNVNRKSAF